uniref:Uncharacterized protein n=1 Tax=Oryza brachyantha TaxID=4533 RepID=J3LWQ1_ORYBR
MGDATIAVVGEGDGEEEHIFRSRFPPMAMPEGVTVPEFKLAKLKRPLRPKIGLCNPKFRKEENKTRPSNLQLQLAKTAPHHRHSRRRTEPYFNLRNNLLTQALALALVGEKLSKAEYKPPYSTSNTQERENNECNRVSRIG